MAGRLPTVNSQTAIRTLVAAEALLILLAIALGRDSDKIADYAACSCAVSGMVTPFPYCSQRKLRQGCRDRLFPSPKRAQRDQRAAAPPVRIVRSSDSRSCRDSESGSVARREAAHAPAEPPVECGNWRRIYSSEPPSWSMLGSSRVELRSYTGLESPRLVGRSIAPILYTPTPAISWSASTAFRARPNLANSTGGRSARSLTPSLTVSTTSGIVRAGCGSSSTGFRRHLRHRQLRATTSARAMGNGWIVIPESHYAGRTAASTRARSTRRGCPDPG
jgi:hypothetical protein